jgi:hypothetical protein
MNKSMRHFGASSYLACSAWLRSPGPASAASFACVQGPFLQGYYCTNQTCCQQTVPNTDACPSLSPTQGANLLEQRANDSTRQAIAGDGVAGQKCSAFRAATASRDPVSQSMDAASSSQLQKPRHCAKSRQDCVLCATYRVPLSILMAYRRDIP